MLRSVLIALTFLLLIPTVAHAGPINDSLRIADAAWPGHPCTGQTHVEFVEMGDLAGQIEPETCGVLIDPHVRADAVYLCETIVHEVGHLAGHLHAEGGIMGDGEWPPCHPPKKPPRVELVAAIREVLPTPRAPWRIACGPTALRMRCIASRPGSRTRVYRAGIKNGEWTGFDYRCIAR